MSTVVAVQGNGYCVIGADTRIMDGTRIINATKTSGKIIQTKQYILAGVGVLRPFQVASRNLIIPPISLPLEDWVAKTFIPALRETYAVNGISEDQPDSTGCDLILGVGGRIWLIDRDFTTVQDTGGVYTAGSGGDYALGRLTGLVGKGDTLQDTVQYVKLALKTACKFDSNSGNPVVVYSQGGLG